MKKIQASIKVIVEFEVEGIQENNPDQSLNHLACKICGLAVGPARPLAILSGHLQGERTFRGMRICNRCYILFFGEKND